MTMEITIRVPDTLGQRLQRFQERLPEVLDRGLRELLAEKAVEFQDENEIMALLTSRPAPEQVLAIRPSPELQARVSELLSRSKEHTLSRHEEAELDRYLTLEHLVRLAKAHAYRQMESRA
jgi:predicted transcriptional regulator